MSNYIPTRIFKFIEPTTVEQIFRKCGVPMPDVRLDASARCREALQDAWKETKASARGALAVARLDEVFQDISDIATSRADLRRVLGEIAERGDEGNLLPEGAERMNDWELCARIFVARETSAWTMFVNVMAAEQSSLKRKWFEYRGLDGLTPDLSEDNMGRLGGIVADFFWDDKRCTGCRLEHYRRDEAQHYFFAEIDDSLEYDEQKLPGESEFEVKAIVHPYRVIFAFNTATGEFAVSSPTLKQKDAELLAQALARQLLGSIRGMRRGRRHWNDLGALLDHEHIANACRGTVITRVHLDTLKVAPAWMGDTTLAFENTKRRSVAEAVRGLMSSCSHTLDELTLVSARLVVEYRVGYKMEHFSFSLTQKDDSLRNQPEARRLIGTAFLDNLGVCHA